MLTIDIPDVEYFISENNTFKTIPGQTITIEHSLISISKWEAKWHKSFLDTDVEKTEEELFDYVRCMTLTQNVNPDVYLNINQKLMNKIKDYIEDPMTATTITSNTPSDSGSGPTHKERVTSEIIYYWMIAYNIPVEFQKWHINRLLMLIRVCEEKSGDNKDKKMSKRETASRYRELNRQRREAAKSKG